MVSVLFRLIIRLAVRHPLGSTIVGAFFVLLGIILALATPLTGTADATSIIIGIVVILLGVYLLYRGIKALRKPKQAEQPQGLSS